MASVNGAMPTLTDLITRARARHLLSTLALAGLIAACNAAPAGSPSPGTTNPPSNAPTGTPTVTPAPTPLPSPTFGEGQIEHPTGATDIVLRMEQGGGFVPMEFYATAAPQFTLYGDGTVIFKSNEPAPPFGVSGALPAFLTGKMTEENVQALLQFALGQGRLLNARASYENMGCADCPTTTFVLNAGGLEKVVSVYALSEITEPGPDQADMAGFAQLQKLLFEFQTEAQAGTVSDVTEYDANIYRVTLFEAMGGQPTAEPIDWPWDDVSPDDFPRGDEPGAILHLDRAHVESLLEVPNGGAMGIWVRTEDDTLYQLAFRPLLPDEEALVSE